MGGRIPLDINGPKQRVGPLASGTTAERSCWRGLGIERSPIEAVPALMPAGFDVVDASPIIDRAKSIEQPTELELIRASVAGTEAAVAWMESRILPGRTENQVWAELNRALIAGGGEYLETRPFDDRLLSSNSI